MKLSIDALDRICGNKFFPLSFLIISFLIVLFYSETTSPIYGIAYGDSAVFKMMGHVLLNGGVPYVDYFDHKGPNIYLINAVGESLSSVWGLFSLQVLSLFLVLVIWFKIAQLLVRPTISLLVIVFTIFFFLDYYEYGNLTEEWSLLPSSLALFVSISYFVKKPNAPHEKWRSFVYGLCFGLMFFIRPNDAVMICGGIMTGVFLFIFLMQKAYSNAIINACVFMTGFIIMAAPWVMYFAYHHALEDFYLGLLGFNMSYSEGILHNLLSEPIVFRIALMCIIPILLLFEVQKKDLLWILIPIGIFVILLFGRRGYSHYYMTIVPVAFLIFFGLLFSLKLRSISIFSIAAMLLIQPHPGATRGKTYIQQLMHNHSLSGFTPYYSEMGRETHLEFQNSASKLLSSIPKEERDSIWNYSDSFSAQLKSSVAA